MHRLSPLSCLATIHVAMVITWSLSTATVAKASKVHGTNATAEISRTTFLEAQLIDYNNKVPPNYDTEMPCEVGVHLHVYSFDSVDEATMDFTIGVIVHQTWEDGRLTFLGLIPDRMLELDAKLLDKMWVPDLFIANEKRANFHDVTVPNKMMHIYDNGLIKYKARISLTAHCPMRLQNYPLDSQKCSLIIKSFSYTTKNLKFFWTDLGVSIDNIVLPQFYLKNHTISDCTTKSENSTFTCLKVDFHLTRMIGFCLLQLYIPTTLIVTLSWLSFWLDCDAVPARTSLGILTVLTMTTQGSSAISALPKVSYIKAMDTWLAACLAFVFASMLEFAIVNVLARRTIPEVDIGADRRCVQASASMDFLGNCCKTSRLIPVYYLDPFGKEKATRLDKASRVIFPLCFLLFCTIYWTCYVT